MKTNKNFLSLVSNNVIQLHGFDEIQESCYVEVFRDGKYLLFTLNEREETMSCFKIFLDSDRIVCNETLYNIVKENNLGNTLFLYDANFKHYLSSGIKNN